MTPYDQSDFDLPAVTARAATPLTDAELWSLPRFVKWLEAMPKANAYDLFNCDGGCLVGQYVQSHGIKYHGKYRYPHAPESFQDVAATEPHTFGAALSRARAELAKQGGGE